MSEKFNPRCHVGEVHGIYTIVDMLDKKDKYGHWIYKGVCNECGYEKLSHYGGFSREKSITTKCNHIRANGDYIQYGYTWNNKRIGYIFRGIVRRCYNKNDKSYKWYGAKGVKIYQQWLDDPKSFETWAINNGYDDNLTIDRIESDKDYCPENCRWLSFEENTRRAGKVNWITINNLTLTGTQWAKKIGIGVNVVNTAIRQYGIDKTKELLVAMLDEPPLTKNRKSRQSWFSVYGIQI